MSGPLREGRGGVLLAVHAQPGAKRDEVSGMHGERLRVRTTAPPTDGRANARLVEVLAEAFALPRARVELVGGATSRQKEFLLAGLTLEEARDRLAALVGD